MRFSITHTTRYLYATPATESFMEARVSPPSTRAQTVNRRTLTITPASRVTTHTDFFGNIVEHFSIIHRHSELILQALCEVETHPVAISPEALNITVSEARQIFRSQQLRLYDFLHASRGVQLGPAVFAIANQFFAPGANLGESVRELMHWVHGHFTYTPGATNVETSAEQALALRQGVCQDFAHVMIAVLRSAEIPARYVCGYIETDSQRHAAENSEPALVGTGETHAWVDVGLPNGDWLPLDPTNDIVAAERHVVVSVGRDFFDTSPTHGVFKGAGTTSLTASVDMRRLEWATNTRPCA